MRIWRVETPKRLLGVLLWGLLLSPLAANAGEGPRVASLNVCTDQLVMLLVPEENIASLSYLAVDPEISAMAERARGLPLNHGLAEEILPLKPDLVVAGRYSARPAVNILRKLGHEVLDLEPEYGLGDFRRNLRTVAEAVGEEAKAESIIAEFDARLAALTEGLGRSDMVFADYNANGMTSGAGTMVADVARHAGLKTLGEELGFAGIRRVSLEQLILSRPDIVDAERFPARGPSLGHQTLRHPAFRLVQERARSLTIPSRYLACGTPKTLDALEMLIEARGAAAS